MSTERLLRLGLYSSIRNQGGKSDKPISAGKSYCQNQSPCDTRGI